LRIERDPAYPFARIVCAPLAGVDRHRALLIVSGLPGLPARPAMQETDDAAAQVKKRGRRRQP